MSNYHRTWTITFTEPVKVQELAGIKGFVNFYTQDRHYSVAAVEKDQVESVTPVLPPLPTTPGSLILHKGEAWVLIDNHGLFWRVTVGDPDVTRDVNAPDRFGSDWTLLYAPPSEA